MFGSKDKDEVICPLLQKPCIGMRCRFLIRIAGKHPQTGQEFDDTECSFVALPLLLIENARLQNATAGAIESFRNESVANTIALANALKTAALAPPAQRVIDITP